MGTDKEYKEWDRDGKAYFHRSAAVLLSGHPYDDNLISVVL
jgi:hypothetical protein